MIKGNSFLLVQFCRLWLSQNSNLLTRKEVMKFHLKVLSLSLLDKLKLYRSKRLEMLYSIKDFSIPTTSTTTTKMELSVNRLSVTNFLVLRPYTLQTIIKNISGSNLEVQLKKTFLKDQFFLKIMNKLKLQIFH